MASQSFVPPQLATLAEAVPLGDDWLFEVKYDGYRLQAQRLGKSVRILTRRGHDWTERFPTVRAAIEKLDFTNGILDGEAIATDAEGRISFQSLQQQLDGHDANGISFVAFDLLLLNNRDLRQLPLKERRAELTRLLQGQRGKQRVRLSEELPGPPELLIQAACRLGMEGIIAKRTTATYQSGRNRDWLKIKCGMRQEFVVIGFTPPQGAREAVGALVLGYFDETRQLHFAGRVGTGMSSKVLVDLHRRMIPLRRDETPLKRVPLGLPKGVQWLEPSLVVEVAFTEWTDDGQLRHPSFQGIREDKPARQVRREMPVVVESPKARTRSAKQGNPTVAGVSISSPERVVYPEAGLTKLDVARYFEQVAELMLPHLAGRPLSLVRCPEGSAGECFFQKHWPGKQPEVFDTVRIKQSDGMRPYTVVRDVAGLVTLAQWGVLEIHPWGSLADAPEKPDRITFDLDPGEGSPWTAMRSGARRLRKLLEDLGLESWLKTSGGKGLHVVVPIQRKSTWDEVSDFARAVAEHMAWESPDEFVSRSKKTERTGKIFVDWMRNTRGATSVAAWSPRARPRAGVSVPIPWSALGRLAAGDSYTISSPGRRTEDPWSDMLRARQGLTKAVSKSLANLGA